MGKRGVKFWELQAICFCSRFINKAGHFEGCSYIQISSFRMKYNFISKTDIINFFFLSSVSTNDSESYMNEEKKEEDLLNKCMQSMSIEERGEEHLMWTWQSCLAYWWCAKGRGEGCECVLSPHLGGLLVTIESVGNFGLFRNFYNNVIGLM